MPLCIMLTWVKFLLKEKRKVFSVSINVSCISNYFSSGGQSLSETTRAKLRALGIDPSNVTTESEAQILIQNAQTKLNSVNKTQNTSNKTVCTSECEVLTKAKNLARKTGITIRETDPLDKIIQTLTGKINEMVLQEMPKASEYNAELETIKNEYSAIQQNQNSMYAMMNMNGNVNKFMLGL